MIHAAGISGDNLNKYEQFIPGSEYRFSYSLVGSKTDDLGYDAYVSGNLAKYTELEQKRFEKVPKKSILPIIGVIKFPEELEPGWNRLDVCVVEDCPVAGTVCGRSAACAQIAFMALYPGINPIVTLISQNVNENDPIDFKVVIENLGKENIQKASGFVEIYNLKKETVGIATLESKPIESGKKDTLIAHFETIGLPPGNYSATAFIDCDDVEKTSSSIFRIGTLEMNILSHTNEMEIGGIKKFITTVESAWNDPVDVSAEVRIYDKNTSTTAKTATYNIDPWKRQNLEAFIDTSDLEPKEYDVLILLSYAEKTTRYEGKVLLVKGTEAEPEEKKPLSNSTKMSLILMVIVVILTIFNIFLAVSSKRELKNRRRR